MCTSFGPHLFGHAFVILTGSNEQIVLIHLARLWQLAHVNETFNAIEKGRFAFLTYSR